MTLLVKDAGKSECFAVMAKIEVEIVVLVSRLQSTLLHPKGCRLPMQVLYYEKAERMILNKTMQKR
jgi:hypothetical protein